MATELVAFNAPPATSATAESRAKFAPTVSGRTLQFQKRAQKPLM
jgi:hypothetical protein